MTTPELVAWIKKNPVLVGCGMASLALAAAVYFRSGLIGEANTELDEKNAAAARYALNLTNAVQLKEQIDQLTNLDKAIQTRLIRATEIGINQQYFYKLESETGVKLVELSQSSRQPGGATSGPFAPVGFRVAAQGDFSQVLSFLRALESEAHFCRVFDASVTGSRKGSVSASFSLELLGQP